MSNGQSAWLPRRRLDHSRQLLDSSGHSNASNLWAISIDVGNLRGIGVPVIRAVAPLVMSYVDHPDPDRAG
jgi:hypothetical protein